MKTKFIAIFALVLCMSAFFLPVSAYAATDTTPPTVTAKITGNALKIEAKDTDSGVEAVFIDEKRFNYRVDSVIEVDAREYVGNDETVSIYAVDFAGNKSEVVTINNPYYVAPTTTPEPTEPSTPTQSNPFTPPGQASVVDEATESDGKDFYTFTTPAGNVFYLIIDHQRNADNVYFLNAITEDDLAAIAEKSDKKPSSGAVPTTEPKPTEKPVETEKPAETEKPKDSGNSGMIIFIVLALAAAGGAGYYFKILKPKQQAASAQPDDDYEDDGEEMEFEDEPDDDEDDTADDETGTDDDE